MSDLLLRLGANPGARRLVKLLGLPLPLPQALRRASGPWEERPLADANVVVGAATAEVPASLPPRPSALQELIVKALVTAGANPHLVGGEPGVLAGLGEAYGRPIVALDLTALSTLGDGWRADALVFDATGLADPSALRALHDFFHPLLSRLATCGRVVVLGRPPVEAASVGAAAAQGALEGFVRSLAKEIGKRGATAQLLIVHAGAKNRLEPVLRFLLSARAAFVTGQPIAIDFRVRAVDGKWPLVRPLDGKVALVTGAARGIGEATARLLAGEGARVICLDRPGDAAAASQLARAIGGEVLLADIADGDAPQAIAHALGERGGVDILVHNAGITRDKTLARMPAETWAQVIDVNLAAILRIDAALDQARPGAGGLLREGGREICLASVAGIAGNVGQTNYAASKAGVAAYVRRRAEALAPRGIAVNAVAPGFIETRLTAAIPVMIREAGRRLSALGQGGLPADVGEVITFLASPGAAGITGGLLRICGGALIGA